MKTYLPTQADVKAKAKWYIIDAAGKTVGKVAEKAARVLIGKDRTDLTPHIDLGDGVIIINAEKVELTGRKLVTKMYRSHSGYRGNLKEVTAEVMLEKQPAVVLEKAIERMLPKNKLRDAKLLRLKVFAGTEHPHAAQKPEPLTV